MHVRFSTVKALAVVDRGSQEPLGAITGILLHPDRASVEGFFVAGAEGGGRLFLPVTDIARVGTRIEVRHRDAPGPLEDHVRQAALVAEGRPILGQRMTTEQGRPLGRCRDVQFDTDLFRLEALLPRKWFRWRLPVAASAIVEVRPEAVIVRDPQEPILQPDAARGVLPLPEVTPPTAA